MLLPFRFTIIMDHFYLTDDNELYTNFLAENYGSETIDPQLTVGLNETAGFTGGYPLPVIMISDWPLSARGRAEQFWPHFNTICSQCCRSELVLFPDNPPDPDCARAAATPVPAWDWALPGPLSLEWWGLLHPSDPTCEFRWWDQRHECVAGSRIIPGRFQWVFPPRVHAPVPAAHSRIRGCTNGLH